MQMWRDEELILSAGPRTLWFGSVGGVRFKAALTSQKCSNGRGEPGDAAADVSTSVLVK